MNEELLNVDWVKENEEDAKQFVKESSLEDFYKAIICVWQTNEDLVKIWLETPILVDGDNFLDSDWVLKQEKKKIHAALAAAEDVLLYKIVAAWNSMGGSEENSHTLVDLWSQNSDFVNRIADLTTQLMEDEEEKEEE